MTRKNSDNYAKATWEKQHGFVIIDLSSKNTTVNIEVGLTSFTYKIKIIIKTNIIFSLQNRESSYTNYK